MKTSPQHDPEAERRLELWRQAPIAERIELVELARYVWSDEAAEHLRERLGLPMERDRDPASREVH